MTCFEPPASGLPGRRLWTLATVLVALALACAFYAEAHAHRTCCDAIDYWRIAAVYGADGLFANHPAASLRTYPYPAMLWLVTRAATAFAVEPAKLLFAFQFAWHAASCWLLANALFPARLRVASMLFALLACSPFALPYLGVALTDSIALGCFNVWLAAIATHNRRRRDGGDIAWLALAATMAGAACAIRPAYVWLLPLTVMFAVWSATSRGHRGWLAIALSLLLPWAALGPQIAINKHLFDRATPLPVSDLGSTQVRWGITYLKYATAPKPGSDARMFYRNPIAGQTLRDDEGLGWYARHPLRGIASLSVKLVAAFDFDYLPAYVWNREPPLQWVFRALSLMILPVGLQGVWSYARQPGLHGLSLGPRMMPPLVMLGWGAITLVSAVELRFTLPMLSLLMPMCLAAALDLRDWPWTRLRWRIAAFATAFVLMAAIACFVARQNVLLHP